MKRINKFIMVSIMIIHMLFNVHMAFSRELESDVVVSIKLNDPIMEINGVETEIDEGRGTKPIVQDNRTLVPIRAIIEAFGGKVSWDESTKSVILTIKDDTIKLVINSDVAYLNEQRKVLDTAPVIIDGRTMLPIRFIAEGFNLGVAWDETTKTVSVIRQFFDDSEYNMLMSSLPKYSGYAYTVVNDNKPFFKDYEIIEGSFEYYCRLDELGRCDVCFASVGEDLMPTEKRESITSVTPTGWINKSYDSIEGGYLYNRCHLIGFQLTGENANEKNLITGTRYLNIEGMLPFENMVDDYIEATGNRVIYRATPVFTGNNLVADGVLLEAYSVEDNGEGISFCVFCYNVQPQIRIDYATGKSSHSGEDVVQNTVISDNSGGGIVYRTPTGKRYHFDAECGGKNSFKVSLEEALNAYLTPCAKCVD